MGCSIHDEPQYRTCGACVSAGIAGALAGEPEASDGGEVRTTEEVAERLGIDLD